LYFASPHSKSSAGQALSKSIAATVGVAPLGRAIPMLKNTRSPAVVIAVAALDEKIGGAAAQGVINLFATLAEDRVSTEE
jgi:hypothetical protein